MVGHLSNKCSRDEGTPTGEREHCGHSWVPGPSMGGTCPLPTSVLHLSSMARIYASLPSLLIHEKSYRAT